MTVIIATTVSETKRGPRVWLEGHKLIRGQFGPETRYEVVFKEGTLTLRRTEEGSRKVSSRRDTPIIDLCSKKLAEWFKPGEKLKAVIRKGRIIIRRIAAVMKAARRDQRIIEKIRAGQPLNMVSAFSGGGVMDRAIHDGFKRAGIRTRSHLTVEIEGKYIDASLKANPMFDKDSVIINAPIQDINLGKVVEADVFCAGIPCLGASRAGKARLGLKNAESHPTAGALFYSTLQMIEKFSPAIVILENVGSYRDTASFEVIRSLLSTAWGYKVHTAILNGNDYGALENRDRLVVVAVSKRLQEMGGFDISHVVPVREKEATLADALEPIADDDDRWTIHEYLERKEASDVAAGKGFRRQLYTGSESKINTVTRDYAKIRSTDPHIKHPAKPRATRLLTPVEHARVKGLPEGWIQSTETSDTIAHQILGQSVIFPLFDAVGAAIGSNLKRLAATHYEIETASASNDTTYISDRPIAV
ncbi:DNA cytosine methyltransferase [Marinobacter subterrani]|uniref:DNA cytosine methyltransferase n=1 Tax=Marinobacter subterrani TaxID=1658765 RepID=UPI00235554AD|nr:DNA cytosine methyltransferase [Marinobacter subterrani]